MNYLLCVVRLYYNKMTPPSTYDRTTRIMSVVRSPTRSDFGVGRSDSQPNLASCNIFSDNSGTNQLTLRTKRKRTAGNDAVLGEIAEMRKQMTQLMSMLTTINLNQEEFMDNISKDITSIKDNLSNIKSTTETLSSDQKSMQLDIEHLSEINVTTKAKLEALESEITMLKASPPSPMSLSSSYEAIAAELNDRELRSRNIIIGGVPEQLSKEPEERTNLDKRDVFNIIKTIDPKSPEPASIFRIGKYNPKKIRHLKICFKSHESAKDVLRNRHLNKNDTIKIFGDQTPKQQEHFKKLKEELKLRIERGENQLTIKYINGVPKIIETRPKNLCESADEDKYKLGIVT